MTPTGIETATFRFVAQHLNQCATAVPHCHQYRFQFINSRVHGLFVAQYSKLINKQLVTVKRPCSLSCNNSQLAQTIK